MTALPALGGLGAVAYLFAGPRQPMSYVAGGFFLLMSVSMVIGSLARNRSMTKSNADDVRRSYLTYLESVRRILVDEPNQAEAAGVIRIGVSDTEPPRRAVLDESALSARTDPFALDAARRLVAAYASTPPAAVTVPLSAGERVSINGATDDQLREIVCAAAHSHPPEELAIAVVTRDPRAWQWLKWLPHARHAGRVLVVRPEHIPALASAVLGDPQRDWLVVAGVLDEYAELRRLHAVVIAAGTPAGTWQRLHVDGKVLVEDSRDEAVRRGMLRGRSRAVAEAAVRALAAHSGAPTAVADRAAAASGRWTEQSLSWEGVQQARREIDPQPHKRLVVQLGCDPNGGLVELDLKESAEGGAGPHGLIIGATGSGKSELLRTIVLGLAAQHDSRDLAFVLVDFKGGAAFHGFGVLPHTCALITNLQAGQWQVDRMLAALSGELHRRQELLADAGSQSQREYLASTGRHAEPMPTLLVVIDEFSELLAQRPELTDLLVQIGRLGRSLGIHLLLASQRLDEGRLRGLESHLSYRIALRTFSAAESRTVIGSAAAYELPRAPGHGYLKTDADLPARFRATCLAAPVTSAQQTPADVRLFEPPLLGATQADDEAGVPQTGEPIATRLLRVLDGTAPPVRQIWLPPLGLVPLHELLDDATPPLVVPIGVVDRPFEQRVERYLLDLAGAGGHVAIVGGPRSGKSSAVRTLVQALQHRHRDGSVAVYCLDLGGGVGELAGWPIVGSIAPRLEMERVRRTVAFVMQVLNDREASFARAGIRSVEQFRQARSAGAVRSELGDVFLVIDGISALRADFEDLEDQLTRIAARGLAYGVHLVVTAHRWMELRPALRELIATRVELRLGDPIDSQIDRKSAAGVPDKTPGRGLAADGGALQIADPDLSPPTDAVASPKVPMLPRAIEPARLPQEVRTAGVCLGVEGIRMRAVMARTSFQVVLGDARSGKSSHLRAILHQIPETDRVVVIDYRRSLPDAEGRANVVGYASDPGRCAEVVSGLVDGLMKRRDTAPSPGQTAFVPVHLLIDDYDLVAAGAHPLAPLAPMLGQARDLDLHIYLARRSAGAARALLDPVMGALRELGAAVTVLSGSPDEGMVCGVRPTRQPMGRGTHVDRDLGTVPIQLVTQP
ncbi:type VII secretion protein EccC [Epidermidibacterium keratini]